MKRQIANALTFVMLVSAGAAQAQTAAPTAPPAGSEEFSFSGNNFKEFELSNDAYPGLTIELWAKRGVREVGIMLFHSGTSGRQYPGVRVTGELQWVAGGGPRYPNGVNAAFQLPRDTWVHLAFVKNATTNQMIVYVNGVEKVNVQGGTDRQAHDAPTGIGIFRLGHSLPTLANGWSESWMAKHGFEGQMAEVRIWKTVRTPQEILAGMQLSTAQLPSKDGLLLYGPVGGNLAKPALGVNIAGEWTYGDGGGKASIQQVGSSVTYQGTWLSSNDKYELKGEVNGNALVGSWTLLGTSETGTAKIEIAADAASMKVVEATGGRGWPGQVFIRQQ